MIRRSSTRGLTAMLATVAVLLGACTDDPTAAPPPTPPDTGTPLTNLMPSSPEEPVAGLSPRETVTSDDADLVGAAVSLGDPDVRVSRWATLCQACPKDGRSKPTFVALALTTDGYRTTTYVPDPLEGGRMLVAGSPVGEDFVIESPTDDLFLLNDDSNGREWLVGVDGSVRHVARVDTPMEPTDPRLWFLCTASDAMTRSWCALDPVTATAYQWPTGSNRGGWTESRPGSGGTPWGMDYSQATGPVAWWQASDGTKQTRPLALAPSGEPGVVHHSRQGPLFWDYTIGAANLDLLVVSDPDGRGRVVTRPAPDVQSAPKYMSFAMGQTPEGALLAWSAWPRMRIWRADDLTQADFELVFEDGDLPGRSPMTIFDRQIQIYTLSSDDDGRTWSDTTTWR